MDLKILNTRERDLGFNFSEEQQLTSGIQMLIQEVVIELLSDFNSVYARGAGLRSIIEGSDPSQPSATRASIADAVAVTKTHILANQQDAPNLTPSERISNLELLSAESANGVEWAIEVRLTNASGEIVETGVVI